MDIQQRRERHKANKENARQKAKEFIAAYLAEQHCVDCGETDLIVLTFDHVRGTKRGAVSEMVSVGRSIETIKEEVAKCDVVCFNCHMRREHKKRR